MKERPGIFNYLGLKFDILFRKQLFCPRKIITGFNFIDRIICCQFIKSSIFVIKNIIQDVALTSTEDVAYILMQLDILS